MNAAIITIGDELLIGQVENTNASWIAREFNDHGIGISNITTISDQEDDILYAIEQARKIANLIVITGGLGPTNDDITKNTLCNYFDTSLVMNQEVLSDIKTYLAAKNASLNEHNKKQAEVPQKARIIRNEYGTAPGLIFEDRSHIIVALPGVPKEMKNMIRYRLIPILEKEYELTSIYHKTIMTHGCFEAQLAEKLVPFEKQLPDPVKLAYLPSPGHIRLRLSISGVDKNTGVKMVEQEIQKLREIIPDYIFGYDNQPLHEVLGNLLRLKRKTIVTAESCTGGAIAKLITSIPGCSEYYKGSIVAYDNKIKESLLGVDPDDIYQHGAVSRHVVETMVSGAIKNFDADFAITTSGIAGPTGGTQEKPVGTTWIAVGDANHVVSKKFLFGNHRDRNILKSAFTGMNMMRKFILGESMNIYD